jgi:hypothetical protein
VLLVVELRDNDVSEIEKQAAAIEAEMRAAGFGYHFLEFMVLIPSVFGIYVRLV